MAEPCSARTLDADDHLPAIDVLDLETDDLTGAPAGAVADAEQEPVARIVGHRQQAPRLILAEDQRHLLRLLDELHLGQQIEATQRDAEQKAQAGHRVEDARFQHDVRLRVIALTRVSLRCSWKLRRSSARGAHRASA